MYRSMSLWSENVKKKERKEKNMSPQLNSIVCLRSFSLVSAKGWHDLRPRLNNMDGARRIQHGD
jgi:hypothetical protein